MNPHCFPGGSEASDYGFTWGPMEVVRATSFEWKRGRGKSYCLFVCAGDGQDHIHTEIYVSPKGKRVRVFQGGRELK